MKKTPKLLQFNGIKCVVKIRKKVYNGSRGTKVSELRDNYVLRLYVHLFKKLKEDIRNVVC